MGKKGSKLALGVAIAGAAGYIAGVLTAPKSGKETRQDIKEGVNKGLAEAEKQLKALHTELTKVIADARARSEQLSGRAQREVNELVDKAKDTKEKVREVLSAIHEGDAEDKDLQRAIKDANAAIEHIKNYLQK